jgi:putative nucleotidyltransferase with HDIG domain
MHCSPQQLNKDFQNKSSKRLKPKIHVKKIHPSYPVPKRGSDTIVIPFLDSLKTLKGFMELDGVNLKDSRNLTVFHLERLGKIIGSHLANQCRKNARIKEKSMGDLTETIKALTKAIEAKDPYTFGHSEKVAEYAVKIAERMGLSQDMIKIIKISGQLHDIGKISIPEKVLLKPEKLTIQEYNIVKRHPIIGFEIVKSAQFQQIISNGVRHHHESLDGTGYPDALKGRKIPLVPRILAVADAFSAMTSERSYRPALSVKDAMDEILTLSGKRYDPDVVEILKGIIEEEK